jgi:methylenetetrahydrofolate dehydrogenase (NADP+)/methenyltetrahydrofolate cyclohydrolase
VRDHAIVIDIGISRANGKVIGDADYENVSKKVSGITPVPGGVGPMTIAMLLKNTVLAASRVII